MKILLIPLIVGFGAQAIKLALRAERHENVRHYVTSYGGMPSSHTAFVISLATVMALKEGLTSPFFALTLVYALLVIRDATGLRHAMGRHSEILNRLATLLPQEERRTIPHLEEHLGHTPAEAVVGAIWGFVASGLLWVLLP